MTPSTPTDATHGPESDDGHPPHPCGHRTRHTSRIGCCSLCAVLFSSDTAFAAHIKGRVHLPPEDVGLTARPSKTAPGETVWSLPGGYFDHEETNV